jgi:glycosyltransferase involved in cell wall biosynthesis
MASGVISFIIPAYNEESMIARVVESIRSAVAAADDIPGAEIIVVDDASTDRTAEIARAAGAKVIAVHRRHISAVRNAGAGAARGDVLIFLDGDTLLPQETLRAALHALRDGAIGGGCAVRFDGEVPLYARASLPLLVIAFRWLRLAAGCFIFCRREAFEEAGGFDERLFASEEVAFSMAMKRRGRFIVLHQHVVTSGRKVRQYTIREILATLLREGLRGPWACRRRESLGFWYEGRREA